MTSLEELYELIPTGEAALDQLIQEHGRYLTDITRGAQVPEGEPDRSRANIISFLNQSAIAPETKNRIIQVVNGLGGIEPPREPGANEGTGKPFMDPSDAE